MINETTLKDNWHADIGGRSRRSQFGERERERTEENIYFSPRQARRVLFSFSWKLSPIRSPKPISGILFFCTLWQKTFGHHYIVITIIMRLTLLSLGGAELYRFQGTSLRTDWAEWDGPRCRPSILPANEANRCWWPLTYRRDGLDIYGWVRLDVAHLLDSQPLGKKMDTHILCVLLTTYGSYRCSPSWLGALPQHGKKGNNCNQHKSRPPLMLICPYLKRERERK